MIKYFETNENKNAAYPGLQDAPNAVLRGQVTATNAYVTKRISNNLFFHFEARKSKQNPKQTERRKQIIVEVNYRIEKKQNQKLLPHK